MSDMAKVCLVAACFLFSCAAGEAAPEEETTLTSSAQTAWDCYAPKPGHPTPAEKAQFFTTHAAAAQDAERIHGVPAAALLAMAAVEGGFGFTRIALDANNVFGYKFTNTTSAGGRGSYTLGCQPAWDVGNQYIVFSNVWDAMLFVGKKLANRNDWVNYKAATDRYKAARAAGTDVTVAVNAWIDGIADEGYNYDPPTYKRTIKGMAAANSLYNYSR